MSKFLIDTNVLVDYPHIVLNRQDLVIPLFIVEELDDLKRSESRELGKRARKASQLIKSMKDSLTFDDSTLNSIYASYADEGLIKLAKTKRYGIITNDINLQLKCEILGIPYQDYTEDIEDYTGVLRLCSGKDDDLIADIYSHHYENLTLHENEYIIIFGLDDKIKQVFKWVDNELKYISFESLDKSIYCGYTDNNISAKNIEQALLIDSLYSDSTIVCALGPFGSGKSYLCANYALQQLKRGKINKIVYVPNNSQVEASEEIAALPGELFEKMLPYMGTLVDIMGSQDLEQCCENGQIEIIPIALARGRNLDNAIIFVNEAQNLTEEHIKLLLGRVAKGSRIFFDGDIKQSDKQIFKERNGLRLLLKLKDSPRFSKIFSVIRLRKTERSETAMAAQYLDEIQ